MTTVYEDSLLPKKCWTFADTAVRVFAGLQHGPKTSSRRPASGYHQWRLWNSISRFVPERGCRAIRALMGSSSSAFAEAGCTDAQFVRRQRPKKRTSAISRVRRRRRKRAFDHACDVALNVPRERQPGWERRILCRALCG